MNPRKQARVMFLCNRWTSPVADPLPFPLFNLQIISPVILTYTGRRHCFPALSWCCSVSASPGEEVLYLGKNQFTMEESQSF